MKELKERIHDNRNGLDYVLVQKQKHAVGGLLKNRLGNVQGLVTAVGNVRTVP